MVLNTISSILKNRELIWEMTLRDLRGINKGASLGWLWLFINPIVQVTAYVAIVSFVFKARLASDTGPFGYALYVLSGMIPWQMMTKAIQESPSLIRERMDLVKQVIYPIETLPLSSLMVSSLSSLISLSLFLILSIHNGSTHWTFLLLPIPLFFLSVFVLGVAWLFSVGGVILKDLREMVTIIFALAIYFSPVLLSPSMVGDRIWQFILWNPLSHTIICFRDVFHSEFHWVSWFIFVVMSLLAFLMGGWVITRTKLLINEYI